jgi:hypothetical protein
MPQSASRVVYEFSGFHPQKRLLLSASEGRPVAHSPKVFDTLLYFVERRGEANP